MAGVGAETGKRGNGKSTWRRETCFELPAPWSELRADDGGTYFWNSVTGESLWDRPMAEMEA